MYRLVACDCLLTCVPREALWHYISLVDSEFFVAVACRDTISSGESPMSVYPCFPIFRYCTPVPALLCLIGGISTFG